MFPKLVVTELDTTNLLLVLVLVVACKRVTKLVVTDLIFLKGTPIVIFRSNFAIKVLNYL